MTAKMEVSFLKPVSTSGESIKLLGKIVDTDKKYITVHTRLFNDKGDLCSEASVVYRVFPQELAVRKLNYPGPEAFYA
jgi:acyl-coenzyme A thioesterase PaaI-like protein